MIPPNKYLTFTHNYYGSIKYNGIDNFNELYNAFIKNPYDLNNIKYLDYFNNKLSKIELNVINKTKICIVFVLDTSNQICRDVWKKQKKNRDKILSFIEKSYKIDRKYLLSFFGNSEKINKNELLSHINDKNSLLVEAWDVYFKHVDKKIADGAYAIIGIESIMDVPFDKKLMVPGNIFILNTGNLIYNNLNSDLVIDILKNYI